MRTLLLFTLCLQMIDATLDHSETSKSFVETAIEFSELTSLCIANLTILDLANLSSTSKYLRNDVQIILTEGKFLRDNLSDEMVDLLIEHNRKGGVEKKLQILQSDVKKHSKFLLSNIIIHESVSSIVLKNGMRMLPENNILPSRYFGRKIQWMNLYIGHVNIALTSENRIAGIQVPDKLISEEYAYEDNLHPKSGEPMKVRRTERFPAGYYVCFPSITVDKNVINLCICYLMQYVLPKIIGRVSAAEMKHIDYATESILHFFLTGKSIIEPNIDVGLAFLLSEDVFRYVE